MPFLAELLLDGATRHRGGLAWMLGEMAAYNNQRTKHIGAVRAAVEAQVEALAPLLEDSDAEVRDGVAFALSQCPKSKRRTLPKLRARYAAESEPQMKARLLAAIAWLDRKTPLVAEALKADRPPAVRAAAALTLARSDQPWTPDATEAVRDAWAGGEPLEKSWWWGWGSSPLQDLIAGLGDRGPDGAAVLGMLLASPADPVREQAAAATIRVVRAERQARALLVPMLRSALAEAGTAAHPAADALAARPDLIGLARALWRWTADAGEVRPTVLTVLDRAGTQFRQRTPQYPGLPAIDLALELGDASLVPLLRPFLADSTSRTRVPAARAIWRLTGDADGLIGPLLQEVTGRPPGLRWSEALDLLTEIGPAATDALTELRAVAEHPRCPFVTDFDSSRDRWLGHRDDTFLTATRAAITAIDTSAPSL